MPSSRYASVGWAHPPTIQRFSPLTLSSQLFNKEPRWFANRPGLRHAMPDAVQSWVYEPDSLTARLRGEYGNSVAVKVLSQQWGKPFLSERRLLSLMEHRYALIREVLLHSDGKPLILARTVIPEHTIKTAHGNFSRLGSRPLGEVLFADPKLERVDMEVARVEPGLWASACLGLADIRERVWGRRTVYALGDKDMLVAEFFCRELLSSG